MLPLPEPKFEEGDKVWHKFYGNGVILARSFNNLYHASAWQYVIQFEEEPGAVDHLYCMDLEPRHLPLGIQF